jgi:diguanylate cyclase (GGDEF)-like protein
LAVEWGLRMDRVFRTALTIAVVYMLIGGVWIYYSDAMLKVIVDDVATMRVLQTWKGWAYVFVTGVLVFGMSSRALSRQRGLIDRLESLAYLHPLTGLPSRSATQMLIETALERASRGERGVAVVVFDLDNFGAINDSFGHEVGDKLLCALAGRLRECLGEEVSLAHLGADEFVIVFEGIGNEDRLQPCLDKLRQQLARPFALDDVSHVYVSASLGMSFFPHDAESAVQLLRYSDAALARAKRKGPGTVEKFNDGILERARRRLQLDSRLRSALEHDEFSLHYQPIQHSGESLTVVGLEALLRWQPPGEDPVSPGEFIPVAEQSGLILDIGRWVIERACAQIAAWNAMGLAPVTVSINLSIRQVMSPGLVEEITDALDRHRIPRHQLTLEITESLFMEQEAAGREVLAALREEGLRIALDDFGTGYSSLSYLRDLPIDVLKIDRSFVSKLERAKSDRDLVAAVISLAEIFGLRVVAEGVENKVQQEILEGLDCRYFQGFLFSKPVPSDEVPGLLEGPRSSR